MGGCSQKSGVTREQPTGAGMCPERREGRRRRGKEPPTSEVIPAVKGRPGLRHGEGGGDGEEKGAQRGIGKGKKRRGGTGGSCSSVAEPAGDTGRHSGAGEGVI